eukprot:3276097-Amphidinium_carterae.1
MQPQQCRARAHAIAARMAQCHDQSPDVSHLLGAAVPSFAPATEKCDFPENLTIFKDVDMMSLMLPVDG